MRFKLTALTALTLLWPAIASANIVNDPSFELNDGSWFQSGFGIGNVGLAHSGTNAAETACIGHSCVTDLNSRSYIQQTLATTSGQSYDLSFWVAESAGPTSEFSVFWNGVQIADVVNPANITPNGIQWVEFSYSGLLASGTSTVLQVHGRQDPGEIYFDDFSVDASVSAVPEPSSWAMMALGFAGLGLVGYRKTRGALA